MTVVEGDPKAPFLIVITPRCMGGHYSFPWIAPLYPCSIPYNAVKQGGIKYHFCVFSMTRTVIEPRFLGPLAKALTIMPKGSVFANGPGNRSSIPGRVIPKTQKWYLIPPCLAFSTIRWGSRVKWSNPGKGVAPSPAPRCSSYWKGSLRVTLD